MDVSVPVNGGWLWAEDSGGPGPVAVLLHPGIADARFWDLVWPDLTGPLRVIRYDARGYGRSPQPTQPYRQLDDLVAVLNHVAADSAHLVGCSMGGATAIDLALASPERVRSLTLLCPGVTGYPWPAEPDTDAEYRAATGRGEEALVALGLREWAAAGSNPLVADMMRSAVRAWPAEEEFATEPASAFDRLHEVRAPAVLLVGDLDRSSLIACDEAIASRIPGCELVRMPGVDHLPAIREPGAVTRAILAQCQRQAQTAEHMPRGMTLCMSLSLLGPAVSQATAPGLVMFAVGLLAGAAVVAIRQAARRPHRRGKDRAPRPPHALPVVSQPVANPPVPGPPVPNPPVASPPVASPPVSSQSPGHPEERSADSRGRDGAQPGLRIGVLGPLTVNGRPAGLLPAQSQLLVALGLADGGVPIRRLCELLGPEPGRVRPPDSLRQLIVRTRRQLGRAADDREWIEHTGGGRYALHRDARLDWNEFDNLAVRGLAERDHQQLRRAMTMIRGQPFADCCYWWLDLALVERIRQRIVATAMTLAEWELDGHNPAAAARSARAGLAADSGSERLWQLLMRAEHAAGNLAAVRDAWNRCLAAVAELAADQQPEPSTELVFRSLMNHGPN